MYLKDLVSRIFVCIFYIGKEKVIVHIASILDKFLWFLPFGSHTPNTFLELFFGWKNRNKLRPDNLELWQGVSNFVNVLTQVIKKDMPFDTDRQTLWLIGELYAVERYLLGFLGRLHGKYQVPNSRDKKVIRSLDKVYSFSSLFQDRRPDIVAYVCYIQ